ncbi:MAG TPA: rod shape-determining protein MreC [Acidisarcina sp.]
MDSFLSRYKNGLVLVVVLLAQVIGLALQVRRALPDSPDHKPVRLIRYWMVSLIAPPARVSHGAGRGVRGWWSNYVDLRNVRQQNLELQAEVERLRLEQGALAEDARQGQRLQHLLDFKEHYIYQTATAQVIGTAGSDRARLLIIDKGSRDGIRLDMPVITPDGIVGKIREVFPDSAQVLQISDQASGAGVMLETTRIRGVLRGNAYGQPEIINIMPDDRIKPGERVLTSGGDQIYPRGLPVGVVERVANDPERNPYVDVIIKPGANLARLEEVLVITSVGDQLPPAETSDLATSEAEEKQHSAADVLSEKLPSIRDPNADPNAAATADGAAAEPGAAKPGEPDSEVARPLRPAAPLHADRFTPGSSPDADVLTPGLAVAAPPHRAHATAPAPVRSEGANSTVDGSITDTSAVQAKRRATPVLTVGSTTIPKPGLSPPLRTGAATASTSTRSAGTKAAGVNALNAKPAKSLTAQSGAPRPKRPAAAVADGASPGLSVVPTASNSGSGAATAPSAASRQAAPSYVEPYFVTQPADSGAPSPTVAPAKKPKPVQPRPVLKPGGPRPMDRGLPPPVSTPPPQNTPPQGAD